MKEIKSEVVFRQYESISETPEQAGEGLEMAEKAREKAYAPYSKFKVGACVVLANGAIYTGNNQENAAYPDGLCAERVALFKASADNPGVGVQSVYVSCENGDNVSAPCGSCRQVMMEFEARQGSPVEIWFPGGNGSYLYAPSVSSLLPFPFKLEP